MNYLVLLRRLQCLEKYNSKDVCIKPRQIKCLEYLVMKQDVVGVFPTGFGKSLIFQLLADVCTLVDPTPKPENKIFIVVCPLNSLIQDQVKILQNLRYPCGV